MGSSKEYLEYVLEQLSDLDDISYSEEVYDEDSYYEEEMY